MTKYIAFLRAINVGGRNIKMAHLRDLFQLLNLKNIETFIASGNIIFDPPQDNVQILEQRIAAHLHNCLGYEVDTFIRSNADLAEMVVHKPFRDLELSSGANTLYIGLLSAPLTDDVCERLLTHRSQVDEFHIRGKEVYWLRRKGKGQSNFSGSVLEKVVGAPVTLRNWNTIRRLAAKYPPKNAA